MTHLTYFAVAQTAYSQDRLRAQFPKSADRGAERQTAGAGHRPMRRRLHVMRPVAR